MNKETISIFLTLVLPSLLCKKIIRMAVLLYFEQVIEKVRFTECSLKMNSEHL